MDKQVNRAAVIAGFNAAVIASVNVQRLRNLFLGISVFLSELPDTRTASLHVVIHFHDLQSLNFEDPTGGHGYFAIYGSQMYAGGVKKWKQPSKKIKVF